MKAKEKKKVSVLVGVCSCLKAKDRRDAVRETWMSRPQAGVETVFFIGKENPIAEEPDVVCLNVDDSYNYLPEKVLAFFKYAIENYEFEWLYKCDDDTYLALDRVNGLLIEGLDLIGDMSLEHRGAPSGGAGYFLSRDIVEKIIEYPNIPKTGAEDLIYGHITRVLNARSMATSRLRMGPSPFPMRDNDIVSAHWCSPECMRMIDMFKDSKLILQYEAKHTQWEDTLLFFDNGLFMRLESGCAGRYICGNDILRLCWFGWDEEVLVAAEEFYIGSRMVIKKISDPSNVMELPQEQEAKDALLLVQFGCGSNILKGWVNLDLPYFNITHPLIWNDDSVDAFFLEHVIEHISGPEAYLFFLEAFRTLKKGGVLRLAFPDVLKISKHATPEYINFLKEKGWGDGTPGSAIRNIVVNHGHQTVWSVATISAVLTSIGFEVAHVLVGKSEYPFLNNIESHSSQLGVDFNLIETECVEARKV